VDAVNWFLFWLFLHILAAVIAFGPIFVFPIVGAMAQRSPQHFAFAIELNHVVELRLVVPVAVSMLVSGVGLIFAAHINLLASTYLWVSVLLYLLAIAIALGVAVPSTSKLVKIAQVAEAAMPAPGPPPPQVMALINRVRGAGMVLTLLFLIIIFLMVIKPGGLVGGNIFG
jgi:uncharacterized membrane protein